MVSGCAKTATQIVTFGGQMVVEVTLRENFDAAANRYFLVLSTDAGFKTPLPPPDNIDYEFIEPGTAPQRGVLADYYANYYSTWSGYVMAEPGGYFAVPGSFVIGQSNTRALIASLGEPSTKIRFVYPLSQIFGAAVPDKIYFDFSAVNWPTADAKLAMDHLNTTNAYIANIAGSTTTITDISDPALVGSQDILTCTVTIQ